MTQPAQSLAYLAAELADERYFSRGSCTEPWCEHPLECRHSVDQSGEVCTYVVDGVPCHRLSCRRCYPSAPHLHGTGGEVNHGDK